MCLVLLHQVRRFLQLIMSTPTPPTVPPPPIPKRRGCHHLARETLTATLLAITQGQRLVLALIATSVRAGAIRMDITGPEEWKAGDIAVIRNQEAKRVRDIGSLIFETPIQHDYEEGVEVRSLLSSERLEEVDDRLAVVDTNPTTGARFVKFWVDAVPLSEDSESETRKEVDSSHVPYTRTRSSMPAEQRGMETPIRKSTGMEPLKKAQTLEQG